MVFLCAVFSRAISGLFGEAQAVLVYAGVVCMMDGRLAANKPGDRAVGWKEGRHRVTEKARAASLATQPRQFACILHLYCISACQHQISNPCVFP